MRTNTRWKKRHLNPVIKEWLGAVAMWMPFVAMILYGIWAEITF